ncbi:MAG: hypothetical protein F6K54_18805 [Okeania sp. SIO3B5]|uniref:hypothetical protein n=1 Tax=Okeania sp. SIO3B5 TaxID=2607811 RepID=UPI001400E3C4|nr:hypothetical protein [Okeania sp. SIO3B5]NEO54948.1 hypothetical protein [Okeania sp. SIO3B5]
MLLCVVRPLLVIGLFSYQLVYPWKGGNWREAIANFYLTLSVHLWPNPCLASSCSRAIALFSYQLSAVSAIIRASVAKSLSSFFLPLSDRPNSQKCLIHPTTTEK